MRTQKLMGFLKYFVEGTNTSSQFSVLNERYDLSPENELSDALFKQCKPQLLVYREITFHIAFHISEDTVISCSKVSPAITILIAVTKMHTKNTVTQRRVMPVGCRF